MLGDPQAPEHTLMLIGWMTTAIESGERAADEVVAAGRQKLPDSGFLVSL